LIIGAREISGDLLVMDPEKFVQNLRQFYKRANIMLKALADLKAFYISVIKDMVYNQFHKHGMVIFSNNQNIVSLTILSDISKRKHNEFLQFCKINLDNSIDMVENAADNDNFVIFQHLEKIAILLKI